MPGVVWVSGVGADRALTAKLTAGAGRHLSPGFHSQLLKLFTVSLQRAPSAET